LEWSIGLGYRVRGFDDICFRQCLHGRERRGEEKRGVVRGAWSDEERRRAWYGRR
jgi:hypothetical protein